MRWSKCLGANSGAAYLDSILNLKSGKVKSLKYLGIEITLFYIYFN